MSKFINWLAEFFTISSEGASPVMLTVATAVFTALPFLAAVAVVWVVAAIAYLRKPHSYIPFVIAGIISVLVLFVLAGLHVLTIDVGPAFIAVIVDILFVLGVGCCCYVCAFTQNT